MIFCYKILKELGMILKWEFKYIYLYYKEKIMKLFFF